MCRGGDALLCHEVASMRHLSCLGLAAGEIPSGRVGRQGTRTNLSRVLRPWIPSRALATAARFLSIVTAGYGD
jgi:hypothetical protein